MSASYIIVYRDEFDRDNQVLAIGPFDHKHEARTHRDNLAVPPPEHGNIVPMMTPKESQ